MFNLFKTKLWKIGNHRLKKKSIKVGEKTRIKTTSIPHEEKRVTEPQFEIGYMCIDCEKSFKDREHFKDEECYTVIYE